MQKAARLRGRRPGDGLHRRAHHPAPPAAERDHADHRLLDDRHGAGHPARLEPRLSRPRRPAARGRMGRADRRRQELHDARPGGSRSFPASPSSSPASASACSATASPTCCGRAGDRGGSRSRSGALRTSFATRARHADRRRRHRSRRGAGRGAGPRRRIRLGQERGAALDPGPGAARRAASRAR